MPPTNRHQTWDAPQPKAEAEGRTFKGLDDRPGGLDNTGLAILKAGQVGDGAERSFAGEQREYRSVYAIIDDRGSQYKVQEGDELDIQLQELPKGVHKIVFDRVVMLGDGENARIGQPYVESARVSASVVGEMKGEKVRIFKFRRRKDSRLTKGHRQRYLRVQIDKIEA